MLNLAKEVYKETRKNIGKRNHGFTHLVISTDIFYRFSFYICFILLYIYVHMLLLINMGSQQNTVLFSFLLH